MLLYNYPISLLTCSLFLLSINRVFQFCKLDVLKKKINPLNEGRKSLLRIQPHLFYFLYKDPEKITNLSLNTSTNYQSADYSCSKAVSFTWKYLK